MHLGGEVGFCLCHQCQQYHPSLLHLVWNGNQHVVQTLHIHTHAVNLGVVTIEPTHGWTDTPSNTILDTPLSDTKAHMLSPNIR
jgi:hypothetical protein